MTLLQRIKERRGPIAGAAVTLVAILFVQVLLQLFELSTQQALKVRVVRDFVMILTALMIIALILLLFSEVAQLAEYARHAKKRRTRIRIFEGHHHDKVAMFRECERIVSSARTSIIALNSWVEERPHSVHDAEEEARKSYLQALEKIPHHVRYQRIIQVDPKAPEKTINDQFDIAYLRHFKKMLGQSKDLTKASLLYPSTFVIVDDEHLIWQLNSVHESRDRRSDGKFGISEWIEMRAVIIISEHDPDDRRFVTTFKQWFYDLRAQSPDKGKAYVTEAELDPHFTVMRPVSKIDLPPNWTKVDGGDRLRGKLIDGTSRVLLYHPHDRTAAPFEMDRDDLELQED